MSYYPVFLDLDRKAVLVVGGGKVAERKVESLLAHGAMINIISLELTNKLELLVESGKIRRIDKAFTARHLKGVFMVVAATDNKELNHRVSESALKKGLLINAVDQPVDCNFFFPSIVKKGDLTIAISTSGKSPALSKRIRERLEIQYGNEYKPFLILMGLIRKDILSLNLSQEENSRIFHEIVDSCILKALADGDWEKVDIALSEILRKHISTHGILEKVRRAEEGNDSTMV